MAYGDKRDYPKIDIYVKGEYRCTTSWSKTCRDAKERYYLRHVGTPFAVLKGDIKARFQKRN